MLVHKGATGGFPREYGNIYDIYDKDKYRELRLRYYKTKHAAAAMTRFLCRVCPSINHVYIFYI